MLNHHLICMLEIKWVFNHRVHTHINSVYSMTIASCSTN